MAPGFPCQKIIVLRSHLHKLPAIMCPVTNGKFSIRVPAVEVGIFVSFNGSEKGGIGKEEDKRETREEEKEFTEVAWREGRERLRR